MYPISASEVSQILTLACMLAPLLTMLSAFAILVVSMQNQRTYIAVPVNVRVLCPHAQTCQRGAISAGKTVTY